MAGRAEVGILTESPEVVNPPTPHQRLEVDREDLMREATALRERAEFDVPHESEAVIVGYRANGSLSLYFGPDPCFHFDSDMRLRRAYVDGELYRTQGTTFARLRRDRSNSCVELQRHDLSQVELTQIFEQVHERLRRLVQSFAESAVTCVQEIPADGQIQKRLTSDLKIIMSRPLCLAPAINGRR
ncbi:MAG: hypothetical protein KDA52_22070 [Planctomycetaceae bacterium]|nr:hypothetical protein [Planctomycetaceae bacterium]